MPNMSQGICPKICACRSSDTQQQPAQHNGGLHAPLPGHACTGDADEHDGCVTRQMRTTPQARLGLGKLWDVLSLSM